MNKYETINKLKSENYKVEPEQEVFIEEFSTEDAIGIARCYYTVYGDGFPFDYVYIPEEIIERNKKDDHFTVVARTRKGDIVGMAGLFNNAPSKRVYEAGQLMVLPEYRKKKISYLILEYIMENLAKKIDISVIFGEALCNHIFSQKNTLKNSFIDYAIEIDAMSEKSFKIEKTANKRVSLLLCFRNYKDQPHEVYLPVIYSKILEYLYREGNFKRTFNLTEEIKPDRKDSLFDISLIHEAGTARLTISHTGNDFLSLLNKTEEDFKEFPVFQIYLNLADPSVSWTIRHLREKGYFLGGLLPLWFDTDGLLMQKIKDTPDFKGIQLYSERSRKILDFVTKDWEDSKVYINKY